MYRTVANLASKARIASNSSQQTASSLSWYRNYAAKDIKFGVEELAEAVKVMMGQKRPGFGLLTESSVSSISLFHKSFGSDLSKLGRVGPAFSTRGITTMGDSEEATLAPPPRIKFKRLDKTAKHIMQILDKEAVVGVREQREIPDIKPGYIIQLKVEVPENKRRTSIVKGIVIARRNAGLNTTFRLRRLVAGVGVESVFPLYSPNIKEMKIIDKKKVRRAKLYYLRDKMNALKKH